MSAINEIQLLESINSGHRAARAGCYRDGRNNGGVVLFGVDIVGEGQLALCRACVRRAAEAIGMVAPDLADKIDAQLALVKEELDAAREELGIVRDLAHEQALTIAQLLQPPEDDDEVGRRALAEEHELAGVAAGSGGPDDTPKPKRPKKGA